MSEKTQHTKGPWHVGAQNDLLFVLDGAPSPAPYDGPIPRAHGPKVIARPNHELDGYEANARLIAAAPEMFEALKLVAESGKFTCFDDTAWDAVNDALSKAGAAR